MVPYAPFSLLTPRSPCLSDSRGLRFLGICLGRRSLGHRPSRPCRRCALTLRVVTGIAWFVLLLGRGVFLGHGSSRAGWKLRLFHQRPLLCGSLGWNGGVVFLLLDSLDTFPSSRSLGNWSGIGLILVRDGCIPGSPPGGCPRVRR